MILLYLIFILDAVDIFIIKRLVKNNEAKFFNVIRVKRVRVKVDTPFERHRLKLNGLSHN